MMKSALLPAAIACIAASAAALAQEPVRLNLQSTVPSTAPLLGEGLVELTDTVRGISEGSLELVFHEPGALVPPLEVLDAVSNASVDMGFAPAAFWVGKIPAAPLFASVPFGPEAGEYLAWIRHGGGKELWQSILEPFGVHSILCGINPPEASGWFREEVASLDDLARLKMRFLGLGARVMEKFGVATQLLAPPDIFNALQLGTLDAAEFSMPVVDLGFGFYQIAEHYYFPGWHQPATLVELLVNQDKWDRLSPTHKLQLEVACGDRIHRDLAAGEAAQMDALEELAAKGVKFHRWPEATLAKFETAWEEVAAEQAAANADFDKAWNSLQSFRARYRTWRDLGYLR